MISSATDMLNQVAWGLLVLREAGVDTADPRPYLKSALATFTTGKTQDQRRADNVRINLALAALQHGALPEVADWLGGIESEALNAEEQLWLLLVRLRAALAHGELLQAERWHAELERGELPAKVPMGAWFAAWARGRLLEARQETAAAIQAYTAAEAVLEAHAHARNVEAYGASADRRYLMFNATTRRLLDLLVKSNRPDEALWIARNARNRAARMHARARCQEAERPSQASPRPGELQLLYFPRDPEPGERGSAWIGFAATASGTRAINLAIDPPLVDAVEAADDDLRRLSAQLLGPFEHELAEANRVIVMATGDLHSVPFHELPWDDGLLLEAATVEYGLDLVTCRAELDEPIRRALVVSGIGYSLPEEADGIAAILRAAGVDAEHVRAPSAPFSPLLSGRYDLAHIAAHGHRSAHEAMFAADVELWLGHGAFLRRDDILAAAEVPALVYLSACRSSFFDAESLGGGLSLAHSFMLRGSRHVIGSVHDVDAEATQPFADAFYEALVESEPDGVAEAWRSAYLTARRSLTPGLQADLRMLRLFTP